MQVYPDSEVYTNFYTDMTRIIRNIKRKISASEWAHREFLSEMKDMKSILDLGCGYNSVVRLIKKDINKVGVDSFENYIEQSKKNGIHNEYHNQNILSLKNFENDSFDIVLMWDVLEHFTQQDRSNNLSEIERIAKNTIIIFTPNGYVPQNEYDGNSAQEHKSGWNVDDFKIMNFRIRGMEGWMGVNRNATSLPSRMNRYIMLAVSQYIVYIKPRFAFALFCVKDL